MSASHRARGPRRSRRSRSIVLAAALALAGHAGAQQTLAIAAPAARAQTGAPAAESSHWELPRIIYDARQRRSLDATDRALRLGLNVPGAAPSGPRFDGWVSGAGHTHAWVSGRRYAADAGGHLHAVADGPNAVAEPAAGSTDEEVLNGASKLDASHGVLTLRGENDARVHLRVGEAQNLGEDAGARGDAPIATSGAR